MDDRTLEIKPVSEEAIPELGKHKVVGDRKQLEILRQAIIEKRARAARKRLSGHAQKVKAKRRAKNAAERESRRRNR
jgi:hypothetical protein